MPRGRSTQLPIVACALIFCMAAIAPLRAAEPAPALPVKLAGDLTPTSASQADPFSEFVGKKFSRGLRTKKRVALTFDDGPHPKLTPQLIEILKKEGVPATFFMLGDMIDKNPATAKMVAEAGFEIGNHSITHANLVKLDADGVWNEIDGTSRRIEQVSGRAPRLFRPPYGNINRSVTQAAVKDKLVLCMWAIDTRDWAPDATPAKIVQAVLSDVKPGDVILMHDIHAKSIEATPGVIRGLRAAGYEMVTVGTLIADVAAAPPEIRADREAGPAGATMGTAGVAEAPAPALAMPLKESARY